MEHEYFIAARWRNKENVLDLLEKLREKGKRVYCFMEDSEQKDEDPEELMKKFESITDWKTSPMIKDIFEVDMHALRNSETLILLLPAGKSAHIEAGTAYGMGKKCILIGVPPETESLYLLFDEFYDTIDDFIDSLN